MEKEPLAKRRRAITAERPALVHILEDIAREDASGGAPERGRLEAGEGFLEFRGHTTTLRMTPIRDVSVVEGRVVVTYAHPGTPAVSFVDVGSSAGPEAFGAEPLVRRLRAIVGLPPLPDTGPQRIAGKAWACAGAGVTGGFLLGVALGDRGGLGLIEFLEVVWVGALLVLATPVLAHQMGRKARLPAPVRWSLAALALAAGALLGASETSELTIAGAILLGLVVVAAAAISAMRFAPA